MEKNEQQALNDINEIFLINLSDGMDMKKALEKAIRKAFQYGIVTGEIREIRRRQSEIELFLSEEENEQDR